MINKSCMPTVSSNFPIEPVASYNFRDIIRFGSGRFNCQWEVNLILNFK